MRHRAATAGPPLQERQAKSQYADKYGVEAKGERQAVGIGFVIGPIGAHGEKVHVKAGKGTAVND